MAGEKDQREWKLGGRETDPGGGNDPGRHRLSFNRDLTAAQVENLMEQFQFLNRLAEQAGFARVVDSGNRWNRVISEASSELEADGLVSNKSQASAAAELRAFGRISQRLLAELDEGVDRFARGQDGPVKSYGEARARTAERGIYALLAAAVDRNVVSSSPLRMRPGADPLYLPTLEAYSARDVMGAAIGELGKLVTSYLLAVEGHYNELAGIVRTLSREVDRGMPSIISFSLGEGGKPTDCNLTDFPVFALDALDAIYEELRTGQLVSAVLELIRRRPRKILRLGDANADGAVIGGQSAGEVDLLPGAMVELDAELLGSEPIDYWAPVQETIEEGGHRLEMFVGSVQRAKVAGREIALDCEAATTLTEHMRGGTVSSLSGGELMRSMIAQSGWRGNLKLSEDETQPDAEPFEVLVPLQGLTVATRLPIGGACVLPRAEGRGRLTGLDLDDSQEPAAGLVEEFAAGSSYALAATEAAMLNDAEDRCLEVIETALAWLATRARYGAALLPNDIPQDFVREEGLRPVESGSVVLVLGTKSKRFWLRRPGGLREPFGRVLDENSSALLPQLPAEISANDRLALLALRLAASQSEPLLQVQSLWQAIESYCAGVKAEKKLFTKADRKALGERLGSNLDEPQRARLEKAIEKLNEPPLEERLGARLKRDAVPISPQEMAILEELRGLRNAVVHGRQVDTVPARETLDLGISLVARMLVHRVSVLEAESIA